MPALGVVQTQNRQVPPLRHNPWGAASNTDLPCQAMGKEEEGNTDLPCQAMGKEKECTTPLLCLAIGRRRSAPLTCCLAMGKKHNSELPFLVQRNI